MARSSNAHRRLRFSHNRSLPLVLHFGEGSIWSRIRLHVFLLSSYAAAIYILDSFGLMPALGRNAGSLTAVLSMVTGLMVSFRSGSSSDRWHEGRRIWAGLQCQTRTLLRTLVLSLPLDGGVQRDVGGGQGGQNGAVEDTLALIVGFAYALKHHLRDEPGTTHSDLSILPNSFLASLHSSTPPTISSTAHSSKSETVRATAQLNTLSSASSLLSARASPHAAGDTTTNLPLTILTQLHRSLNAFHTSVGTSSGAPAEGSPLLETATWANCLQTLKEFTETLTQAERIRDTPIPAALGIHIQQMLVLHLLTIPPQLVGTLGIWTIPVSAMAAFTFFGVDRIAEELSDPFGNEPNDLPLDIFCADIRREYLELLGRSDPDEGTLLLRRRDMSRRIKAGNGVSASRGERNERGEGEYAKGRGVDEQRVL